MNHVYGHGYACEIASRYQAYRPKDRLEFANRGVSGNTSSNLVERWARDAFPYEISENGYEGALGRKKGEKVIPDCVSILVGINDYFHFIRKDPAGVSVEDYEANLRKLIESAKTANPKVRIVLCEPFRIPTDASPEFCSRQDVVAKLAAEFDCAFVPFQKFFAENLLKDNPNSRYWFWDFFHPTPAGHMRMADFWIDSVVRRIHRTVRNTALEPRAKLEDDSYDWYARHERIVNEQAKIDPEIVFIGDSITHGWEANDSLRGDAAACFRKWFGKYRTLNIGFGWDRIQNVLWRLSHGELDGTKPKIVVIHIGTNNMAPGYKRPFPANTAEEIAEGIVEVCRRVREKTPQAKIVLMDVFPRGEKGEHWRSDVEAVNAALGVKVDALADGNLVRINLWDKYVGQDGEMPKELMFDSLHPTARGYDIWGAALQPIIRAEIARPVPNCAQMKRIREDVELYGIVHWGLNTYTDREWGFGDENPSDLNPAKFDADQIVGACKAGGLQGLIVVAKHHDGFCLWPTKTTGHNISKSPFRGGKGDYVKEMELACRKFGLKFGVYVSPWDRNSAFYGTEKYVTDVFQRQIRELLSGDYGEIFEMWFDGANGGDGYYGGAREKRKIPSGYYRYETETFAMVRKLQPNVCIFNESDLADFRFGGNEQGIVDPNSRSTGGHYDGIWDNYRKWANTGLVDGTTFHPIEADFPLRPGWFYHAKERGKTKCAAYLMQRYLATVGNAATLNLGIAPNRDGLLDEEDVKALKGFGDLQKLFFAHRAKDGEPFNVIVMTEDVSSGELVDAWTLTADGKELLSGRSIGIKRIRVLAEPVTAAKVAVKATSSFGTPGRVSLTRYHVNSEIVKMVRAATTESGETDTAKWMTVGVGKE